MKSSVVETIDLTESDDECSVASSNDDTISCHSQSARSKSGFNSQLRVTCV